MKIRARAVSSDNTKPTIVLNLPGVFFAVLMSAYDSFVHLGVTLSSAATLLLATYHLLHCTMLSMNATRNAASVQSYYIAKPVAVTASTPPLLRVGGRIIASKSTHVDKTNDAAASKRKERQAPAVRRRVLAQLNRNRLLVNVVPGDMRCRVDMNLGEANCSAGQEKHMNPVIMWDVTATFDKFKQLERELEKEVKAKKASRGVQVPHVSSGAVLFVQPELTDHVLNARLQTFIDTLRSDPVLSTMGCLRKFCQTYQAAQPQCTLRPNERLQHGCRRSGAAALVWRKNSSSQWLQREKRRWSFHCM
ncbi:hypothetical protein KRP22_011269 [Phytophthora ramorum]|nr:hypothetical protein KRP22_15267 [Phytophthora ramorum]